MNRIITITKKELDRILKPLPRRWKNHIYSHILNYECEYTPELDGQSVTLPYHVFRMKVARGEITKDGSRWLLKGREVFIDWTKLDVDCSDSTSHDDEVMEDDC